MKWLFLKGETTNQFGIDNDENGHNNAISIQAEQSNNAIIINKPNQWQSSKC